MRHARIHQDMLKRIDQYYQEFVAGPGRLPPGFLHFLVHWLQSHIQGTDRKYAAQPLKAR